jgi:hypothetical protein
MKVQALSKSPPQTAPPLTFNCGCAQTIFANSKTHGSNHFFLFYPLDYHYVDT